MVKAKTKKRRRRRESTKKSTGSTTSGAGGLQSSLALFWLVFTHAGLSIISKTDSNPDFWRRLTFGGQAAATGASLVLLIYSYGGLSGAQWVSDVSVFCADVNTRLD
jgi:hypothetical protein